jgi:hypothetical protein
MHRMAEPGAVKQIAERREGTIERAEDALHQVAERISPGRLRIQDGLEPAAEHAPRLCRMRTNARLRRLSDQSRRC